MTFSAYDEHTQKLFVDLKLLKVEDVFILQVLKFMHQFQKGDVPDSLSNLFKTHDEIHSINTRGKKAFVLPRVKSNRFGTFSLGFQGPRVWNDMCKHLVFLKSTTSISYLKSQFKQYKLDLYSNCLS